MLALGAPGPRAAGGVRDHQPGAARRRRPGGRGLGPDPSVARAAQRRQHHRQRHGALPLRPRRGDRVPDEPVQHRRRRPVPDRRVRRGGRGRRGVAARATSTPPSAIVAAMAVGALWAGIAGVLRADPRGQRGDLDDHAQRHRDRPGRLPAPQGVGPGRGQQRHRDQDDPRGAAGSPTSRSARVAGVDDLRLRDHRRRRRASSTGSSSTRPGSASTCGRPAGRRPRPSPAASASPR